MKLSFAIPAYNEEKVIKQCLDSIFRELEGKDYDAEVIVVNNNSTDRTKEIAESFSQVKVVDEMQKGLVFARRAGFLASTGNLIANVDADTMLPKGWVGKVLEEFEKDQKLVALSGPYIYYDLSLFTRVLVKLFYVCGYFFYMVDSLFGKGAMLQGGNFVVRRDALLQVGGFDTSISFYGEDTDIAKRIRKAGKVLWTFELPMYTSGRRLAEEGIIVSGLRYAMNYFWVSFFGTPFTKEYTDIRPKR